MPNVYGFDFAVQDESGFLDAQRQVDIFRAVAAIANALSDNGALPQGLDASVAARLARIDANVSGNVRNLRAENNATTPAAKVDVTWSELGMGGYLSSNFTGTCDLAAVGLNGRDTSAALATGWYYLHAVYNPSTRTAGLLFSASSSAPSLGHATLAGFTVARFLGEWRQTGTTAALKRQWQQNDHMYVTGDDVGANWVAVGGVTATTTWTTPATLNTWLPPTTRVALLGGNVLAGTVGVILSLRQKGLSGNGVSVISQLALSGFGYGRPVWLPLSASQEFEWRASANSSGTATLVYADVLAWQVPI